MGINRTKLLDRQHDRRDARLFVIATEGAATEKQYFEMFGSSRIKVKVLETGSDNQSAPQYVLDRLNSFKEHIIFMKMICYGWYLMSIDGVTKS